MADLCAQPGEQRRLDECRADGFTDATDPAITLQTVVLLAGNRVFVVGVGDSAGHATTADA